MHLWIEHYIHIYTDLHKHKKDAYNHTHTHNAACDLTLTLKNVIQTSISKVALIDVIKILNLFLNL